MRGGKASVTEATSNNLGLTRAAYENVLDQTGAKRPVGRPYVRAWTELLWAQKKNLKSPSAEGNGIVASTCCGTQEPPDPSMKHVTPSP